MIEWMSPWALLLLPLPILLFWRALRRRPSMRFSSLGLVQARTSWRVALHWLPDLLLALCLVAGIIAFARPQLTNREIVVLSQGIDIMMALDSSGSMETADLDVSGQSASRLDVAKAVMARFIEGRPYDRLGLVVFGEEAFTQVPLTLDHESLTGFLGQVSIGMAGPRNTAIGEGLAIAIKRLKDIDAPTKVIILLTDGQNNAGRILPDDAAEAASSLGIRVYTIGVGGKPPRGMMGMLRGRRNELDEPGLRKIAEKTGGRFYRADDAESLLGVYAEIDQLEKSTAQVKEFVRREERFHRWIIASLVLVVLNLLLSNLLLRRLP